MSKRILYHGSPKIIQVPVFEKIQFISYEIADNTAYYAKGKAREKVIVYWHRQCVVSGIKGTHL